MHEWKPLASVMRIGKTGEVQEDLLQEVGTGMVNLGKIAYQAYYVECKGRSLVSGDPLPKWEDQSPEIRRAWEQAGEAVRTTVLSN